MDDLSKKPDSYWKDRLTPEQYYTLRQSGTEPPFSGRYVDSKESGIYKCAGCSTPLFTSDTKFHSGSGWPSFWDAVDKESIVLVEDRSHGMKRIEAKCAKCGGHLGHVFNDGPKPTGQRYCINSCALNFEKAPKSQS